MRTPAGAECKHYYEDFNRGRQIQECRLAQSNPTTLPWEPKDCSKCPVPAILRANGNMDLILTLSIQRGFLGLGRKLTVNADCAKHAATVSNPYVGCQQCNAEKPGLAALLGERDS